MRELKKLKCRVMASVNPTPHTNSKSIWLSSGHVPLHDILTKKDYLNLLVWKLRELINQEINKVSGVAVEGKLRKFFIPAENRVVEMWEVEDEIKKNNY